MPKLWKQPYFTVTIRPVECRYQARLNDVPIDQMDEAMASVRDVPVNPLLCTGHNHLAAIVMPAEEDSEEFSPEARCELSLSVREVDGNPSEREVIKSIVFTAQDFARAGGTGVESSGRLQDDLPARATLLGPAVVLVERAIELETPFPPWLWLSAPPVVDEGAAMVQVLAEYRKFHAALAAKDGAEVRRLTAVKAQEIGTAFFGDEEEGHQLIEFAEKMNDASMELWPFPEDVSLDVFADRRLVQLVTPEGFGPILYKAKDQPLAAFMNAIYCQTEGGAWIQIR